jgi:hypothetical protein
MYKLINMQWVDVPEPEIPPQIIEGVCTGCGKVKPVAIVSTVIESETEFKATLADSKKLCDDCLASIL